MIRDLCALIVEATDVWREYEAAVCDGLLVWALSTLCVLLMAGIGRTM